MIINVLMVSSIYLLVALGFALVFSVMRILNFAHGALYMVGGYVCYYLWVKAGLNPWASLVLTMLIIGMLGLFLERFCFRPFQQDFEKATVMAMVIIIVLVTIAYITVAATAKGMPSLLPGSVEILGTTVRQDKILVLGICVVLLAVMYMFIQRTRSGWSMMAIAQDREAAALQGINVNRISGLTTAIGCGLAGLAGGLVGSVLVLNVPMADTMLVNIIAVVVLSGIGSIGGIWVGALILGIIHTVTPTYLSGATSEAVGMALIVVILLIRPQGLFGKEE